MILLLCVEKKKRELVHFSIVDEHVVKEGITPIIDFRNMNRFYMKKLTVCKINADAKGRLGIITSIITVLD